MAVPDLTVTARLRLPTAGRVAGAIFPTLACALVLLAFTAAGVPAAHVDAALVPAGRPHPTLHPTFDAVAAILTNNARALAAPFILIVARFSMTRPTRLAGDAVIAVILGANAFRVGLALGHWGETLFPYLPHLPLEYLAASTAGSAWVTTRRRPPGAHGAARSTVVHAAVTLVLITAAAAVEVLLTPHAR